MDKKTVTTNELIQLIDKVNPPKPKTSLAANDDDLEGRGANQPAAIASAAAKESRPNKAGEAPAASNQIAPDNSPVNQDKAADAPTAGPNPLTPAQRAEAQKQYNVLAETGRNWVKGQLTNPPNLLSHLFAMNYNHQRFQDRVYLMPSASSTFEGLNREIESWVRQYAPIARDTNLSQQKKLEQLVALIHSQSVYDPNAFYLQSAIRTIEVNGRRIAINPGGQQCATRAQLAIGILSRFPEVLKPGDRLLVARYSDHDDIAIYNTGRVLLGNYLEWQPVETARANLLDPLVYVVGLSFSNPLEKNLYIQKLMVYRTPVSQSDNTKKTAVENLGIAPPGSLSGGGSDNTFYQGGGEARLKREHNLSSVGGIHPGEKIIPSANNSSGPEISSAAINEFGATLSLEEQTKILDLSASLVSLLNNRQSLGNYDLQTRKTLLNKTKELAVISHQLLFNPYKLTTDQFKSLLEILAYNLAYYQRLNQGQMAQKLVELGLAEQLDHGLVLIKENAKQLLEQNPAIPEGQKPTLLSAINDSAGFDVIYDLSRLTSLFSVEYSVIKTEIDRQVDGKLAAAKLHQAEINSLIAAGNAQPPSQELLRKVKELIALNTDFNSWRAIGYHHSNAGIPAITLTPDEFVAFARTTIEGYDYYRRLYSGNHAALLVSLGLAERLGTGVVLIKEDAETRFAQLTINDPAERKELRKVIRETSDSGAEKVRDDIFRLAWYARMDFGLAYKTIYGRLRTSLVRELNALAPAAAPADSETDFNKQRALLAKIRSVSNLFPAGKNEAAFARQSKLMADTGWIMVAPPTEETPPAEEQLNQKQAQKILLNYLRYFGATAAPDAAAIQSLPGELAALADLSHGSLQQALAAILADFDEITFKPGTDQPTAQVPRVLSLPPDGQSSWTWIDIEIIPMPALSSQPAAKNPDKPANRSLQVALGGFANFVLAIPWDGDPAINFPAIKPTLLDLMGKIKGDSAGDLAAEIRKQHKGGDQ